MVEANEEQLPRLAVVTPAWVEKLQKHGNYYEGIVESDTVAGSGHFSIISWLFLSCFSLIS